MQMGICPNSIAIELIVGGNMIRLAVSWRDMHWNTRAVGGKGEEGAFFLFRYKREF